ncbi:MAG: hypothetical protein CME07_03755 [Gemmatimonadetes bacterium]|nr:hypothetical protein [Gemmatimonadota bacterium]
MNRTDCRVSALLGMVLAGLVTFAPRPAPAAAWEAVEGDVGRNPSRIVLYGRGGYGHVFGTELKGVDAGPVAGGGVAARLFGSFSLDVGASMWRGGFDNQMVHLLDVPFRDDGRSGHAAGQVEVLSIRAGLRLDGVSERDWRAVPYAALFAAYHTTTVTVDSVDGVARGDSFEASHPGGTARAGLLVAVARGLLLDLGADYEVLEMQFGTASAVHFGAGLAYRF